MKNRVFDMLGLRLLVQN